MCRDEWHIGNKVLQASASSGPRRFNERNLIGALQVIKNALFNVRPAAEGLRGAPTALPPAAASVEVTPMED